MYAPSTILALSSPPGRSARAIVRLSGPAVPAILRARFGSVPPRGGHRAVLDLDGSPLPVLLAHFPAPGSYTGEDLIEIQLPGNPFLVERISRTLLSGDVRPATPGEFSARAFLNHKLTLDQAEGIALTIAAEADTDLAAARRLTSGQTGDLYRAWSGELATLLALVEAGIDFTDQEDVVPIAPADLYARVQALLLDATRRLGARRGRESPSALPVVALVGAPNAGKSTLFNALLGRRRAVTSPIAGTTRDILTEPLDLSRDAPGAGPVLLADLAGIDEDSDCATGGLSTSAPRATGGSSTGAPCATGGLSTSAPCATGGSSTSAHGSVPPLHPSASSRSPIDTQAQSRARETLASADILIHCDPTGRFTPLPVSAPTICVRTKADLTPSPADADFLPVCALDGRNLAALRHRIALAIRGSTSSADAILAPRHRQAIALAADRLADALTTIPPAAPRLPAPELTAGLLRESLDALGELTGRISPDDIIGRVFATFCVGK